VDSCCRFSDQERLRLSWEVDECKPLGAGREAGGHAAAVGRYTRLHSCPLTLRERDASACIRRHQAFALALALALAPFDPEYRRVSQRNTSISFKLGTPRSCHDGNEVSGQASEEDAATVYWYTGTQ